MKLDKVVPFGRSLDEYRSMFSLSDDDLNKAIIGISDGPASFNAEMSALGKRVISVDPLFISSSEEIERQFYSVVSDIIDQVKATPGDWLWSYHRSPEHLKENRLSVLHRFVADYATGKAAGRYVIGKLPSIEFEDGRFELALCSHFLFLYSDQFNYEFHRESVLEMLRLATEVRIFPLLTLMSEPSPYVKPLIRDLRSKGFHATVQRVGYELQRGGNEMLRIMKAA